MTTNTTVTPTSSTPARGFGYLPCPACGEEGTIRLDLDTLDAFTCCECDQDFDLARVRHMIDRWQRVLRWIDQAPERE
jgi:hypothetical protein